MKHLLNDLSQSEKNRILEQYNNSLLVDTSKFKKLLESKLGNVKPLLTEGKDTTSCLGKLTDSTNYPGKKYYKEIIDGELKKTEFVYYTTGSYYESQLLKTNGSKYTYPKGDGKYFRFYCEGNVIKKTKEIVTIDGKSNETKVTSVPFKDNTEGNKFRKWVNQNYPKIAKDPSVDLSETGVQADSYKNSYITKAWNYKVGDKTLGELYTQSSTSTSEDLFGWVKDVYGDKSKIQTDVVKQPRVPERTTYEYFGQQWNSLFGSSSKEQEKERIKKAEQKIKAEIMKSDVPVVLKNADRINKELAYINARSQYDGKAFFICDYLWNLVVAFDENHKMIAYSPSVAGKSKQPEKLWDYDRWCTESGEYAIKTGYSKNSKGPYTKPFTYKSGVCSDKNGKVIELNYGIKSVNSQAQGIYKTGGMSDHNYNKNVSGDDFISILALFEDGSSKMVGTGIHATVDYLDKPNEWGRVPAMGDLETTLSVTPGEINPEYKRKTTTQQSLYDLSSGCFNVSSSFIQNKEVQRIARSGAYIFIIGESNDNYLTQIDNPQQYFESLSPGGSCVNPESVGDRLGKKIDKDDIVKSFYSEIKTA